MTTVADRFLKKFTEVERKVLFAALLSMVEDNHAGQDNLGEHGWKVAQTMYVELRDAIEHAEPSQ